jgi:hypothetical protein
MGLLRLAVLGSPEVFHDGSGMLRQEQVGRAAIASPITWCAKWSTPNWARRGGSSCTSAPWPG